MAYVTPKPATGLASTAKLPVVTKKTPVATGAHTTTRPATGLKSGVGAHTTPTPATGASVRQVTPAPMMIPNAANNQAGIVASAAAQQAQQLAASQAAQAQQAKAAQIAQQVSDAARAAQLIQIAQAAAAANKAKVMPNAPGAAATVSNPIGPGPTPAPTPAPVSTNPTAATNLTVAPTAPVSTPAVTATNPTGPSNVGGFTNATGQGGTFGQLQRMRQNRGPQTGTSITPEMLRRMALQRITSGYSS